MDSIFVKQRHAFYLCLPSTSACGKIIGGTFKKLKLLGKTYGVKMTTLDFLAD